MNRGPVPASGETGEVLEAAVADLTARQGVRLSDPLATLQVNALIDPGETLKGDLLADAHNAHTRKEPRTA